MRTINRTFLKRGSHLFLCTFLILMMVGNAGAEDHCWSAKKCLDFLNKYNGHLGQEWQGILKTMIKEYQILDQKQMRIVSEATEILDPKKLYELRGFQSQVETLEEDYEKILQLCQKGIEEVKEKNSDAKGALKEKQAKEDSNKVKTEKILSKGYVERTSRPKGFKRLFGSKSKNVTVTKELKPIDPYEIEVVDQEELDFIFTYLKEKDHIPFDYPDDGCFARADEMVKITEGEMNLSVGKVFYKADPGSKLKALTPNHPDGCVYWSYHVAPYVFLKQGEGKVAMVLDPSLFDKPVTVDEWIHKQSAGPGKQEKLVYTTSKAYFTGDEKLKMGQLQNHAEANQLMTGFRLRWNRFLQEERKKQRREEKARREKGR